MLVNGVHLLPDLSGAVYWPAQRLLALADARFAARGALDRLAGLIRMRQPRAVICLGGPGDPLPEAAAAGLRRLAAERDWTWVGAAEPPCGRAVDELAVGGLVLRHQPRPDAAPGEIAGALSPRATAEIGGRTVTRPCFVVDGRRLILPAFGPAEDGLCVLDPAFRPLLRRGFQALLIGQGRVHALPQNRLLGEGRERRVERAGEARPNAPAGMRFRLFSE